MIKLETWEDVVDAVEQMTPAPSTMEEFINALNVEDKWLEVFMDGVSLKAPTNHYITLMVEYLNADINALIKSPEVVVEEEEPEEELFF